MPGTLFVVATPIGNLEDITARALRVLGEVALIAAEDTRHTARLLARYAISTPTTSFHQHNESAKAAALLERLHRGQDVALVSDAGTPTVSDPGRRLVRAALEAGVRVEPIPGPNAAVAAISATGLGDGTFTFLGFPPVRSKDRKEWFDRAARCGGTVVFYEAPHRISKTIEEVRLRFKTSAIGMCREMTKLHESIAVYSDASIADAALEPRGEYTVVVDIGQTTNNIENGASGIAQTDHDVFTLFCYMTEHGSLGRREAVKAVADKFGLSTKQAYSAIQRELDSAKRPT